MPMTLRRYVNGQVVPIKLSILDALRSSPPPRKKKRVNSKNSTASAYPNAATAAKRTVQAQAAPAIVTDSATAPTILITKQGEDEAHTFTDADDSKLIEMKAAGRTWKEIVAEMKKSQSGLKERFKEIGSNAGSGAGSGPGEKNTGEEGQSQKAANTGKNGHKDASSAGETTSKPSTTTMTTKSKSKPPPGYEDRFTLAEIAAKYDRDKWRFAASKYYDLTGVRISKEQAKKMAAAEE